MSVADQDPPSILVGVRPPRASLEDRSGQQLVQWLSVQADHMAGALQQNVRLDDRSIFTCLRNDARTKLHVCELNFIIQ